MLAIICFALVIPGPLIGIGIIQLFYAFDWSILAYLYDRTITAPVLAQFVKALPLSSLILWSAVTNVPRELLESAAVDGAGRFGRFWRVIWPMVRRSAVVAWLVALAVSLGDLAASILVVPPGVETLAIHLFGLIHYGVDDRVAGITLAMVVAFVAIGIVVQRLTRRNTSRGIIEE
jgi:iron(III) transport system permease protein